MNARPLLSPLAAVLLCGGALLGTALPAQAVVYNPPIYRQNDVEYMSGGIGADEASLMQTVAPRWPAAFSFDVKGRPAAEVGRGVQVTVRASNGQVLLDHVASGGPYMVARLEPGSYEVEAELGGVTLRQPLTVLVGRGTRLQFEWPTNIDLTAGRDSKSSVARAPS